MFLNFVAAMRQSFASSKRSRFFNFLGRRWKMVLAPREWSEKGADDISVPGTGGCSNVGEWRLLPAVHLGVDKKKN